MKKLRLQLLSGICVVILVMSSTTIAYAKTISEIKQEQSETKKQLAETNSTISSISQTKKGITAEIQELDDLLVEILASIDLIEEEITEKRAQIKETKIEYEKAKAEEEKQYEAMKIRLQYMYKNGGGAYAELLLGEHGTSLDLNRSVYVEKVYEYDQNMLDQFVKAKETVKALQESLEIEESELLTSQQELEQEKQEMNRMLQEKKQEEKDFETKLAKAKQEAATYKAKIKQQNAEIRKIQEEEARKAAEEAKKNKTDTNASTSGTTTATTTDTIKNANGSASGKEIANYACKFVGNPYVPGGTSLTNGADCSGFTYAVYKNFGYSIPRTSTAQRAAGVGVNYSEAQPGDLICYAGHVAIYLGGGQIVHASSQKTGIKYGTATYKTILAVRRIV